MIGQVIDNQRNSHKDIPASTPISDTRLNEPTVTTDSMGRLPFASSGVHCHCLLAAAARVAQPKAWAASFVFSSFRTSRPHRPEASPSSALGV